MSSADIKSDADQWARSLQALKTYRDARGTAEVARGVRAFGVDLGKWIVQCRNDYWNGGLDAKRVKALERIEGWQWGPPHPGSWRHAYDTVQAYARKHRGIVAIAATDIDGVDIQAWAAAQRSAHVNGQLSVVQITLLDKLPGWTWDQDETRWQHGILAAKRYVKLHGSLDNVQQDAEPDGYPLGQWLHRCREDFRAGTLPAERVNALESLRGFSWGRQREQWTVGLEVLTSFAAANGHASPSQHTVVDGFRLGSWVTGKRYQYRQGTLPQEQAAALQVLPGWQWSPLDTQWHRGFDALRRYSEQNGHANPPRGHTVDDYPVGNWARAQRDAYDRGRMPSTRAAQLEALPGWSWNGQ
ncbi:helicase associated domain-containing protein [Mycolicibacterium lutetiense]|uniref:Helicase-associated domain-containing protein n=1 Tax=Mycolicibacterium lutetiense TaxID=1641992 RepID=A0ABS5A308_9MYCO|nr:helicase associated domain-containing protein [Mycolicibacterium lutetiense]MBP2456155.1 hypothetical protein [Mycolicibacterium lutetiense]